MSTTEGRFTGGNPGNVSYRSLSRIEDLAERSGGVITAEIGPIALAILQQTEDPDNNDEPFPIPQVSIHRPVETGLRDRSVARPFTQDPLGKGYEIIGGRIYESDLARRDNPPLNPEVDNDPPDDTPPAA